MPTIELSPDLVLVAFLPPLLYGAAFFTPLRELRANAGSISTLAVGLVLATTVAVAVVALALMGVGSSLVDVAGLTLVQRAVPDDVLARVFGVIQMLWLASIGIGAAIVPALISWLGVEASFIAVGALLPVLGVLYLLRGLVPQAGGMHARRRRANHLRRRG
jgi:hypothetical protein